MNLMSLDAARSAGKSVITNFHDTQQGGVKQSLNKQHLTNTKISDGASSNAHVSISTSGNFRQCKTGSKHY